MSLDSSAKKLMGYAFLVVFANEDTISEGEIRMLERMAFEDNVIDEDEKGILRKIFSRVTKDQLTDAVWNERSKFREQNDIYAASPARDCRPQLNNSCSYRGNIKSVKFHHRENSDYFLYKMYMY